MHERSQHAHKEQLMKMSKESAERDARLIELLTKSMEIPQARRVGKTQDSDAESSEDEDMTDAVRVK